jgi:hypothetical protein
MIGGGKSRKLILDYRDPSLVIRRPQFDMIGGALTLGIGAQKL